MSSRRNAKIPRSSDRHDSSVENIVENVDKLDSHIQLTYDVLTIIFKNLNAKDLCNAARVCRCWSEAANNERRVRRKCPLALLSDFKKSWNELSPGGSLIDILRVKPILSMIFTRIFNKNHPVTEIDNVDCPCRILPLNCCHVTIGNNGIVKDKFESEDPLKAAYMLLPEDKEVTIDTIYEPWDGDSSDYVPSSPTFEASSDLPLSKANLQKLKKTSSSKNTIKCFVVFSSEMFQDGLSLVENMPRDRTLSGCLVNDLAMCKNGKDERFCSKRLIWITLMISGRGVHTWSAVLQRKCDTKEKIFDKLSKLKRRVRLKKISICFMFACQGRGEQMFREPNVESTIFKQLFPDLPLIGCSGGGEFGNCSIDKLSDLEHQFSTVFMIVTYGQS